MKLRMLKRTITMPSSNDNRRNIKNTWKGINRLIGNEPKFNKITQLDTGETVNTDPIEISNILNTHFS